MSHSRRGFLKNSLSTAGLITLPSLLYAQVNDAADKKKIVVVGGHPDDLNVAVQEQLHGL